MIQCTEFLHTDWLRAVPFHPNHSAKMSLNRVQNVKVMHGNSSNNSGTNKHQTVIILIKSAVVAKCSSSTSLLLLPMDTAI